MDAKTDERFRAKTSEPTSTGCLLWGAAKNDAGYGYFWWNGKLGYAHRYAWERKHGPIPATLEIDHVVCDNTSCVNDAHLALSTGRANTLRSKGITAVNARKTHCGSCRLPLSGSNLHQDPSGRRVCVACKRAEGTTDKARARKLAWYHKHHGKNHHKWSTDKVNSVTASGRRQHTSTSRLHQG